MKQAIKQYVYYKNNKVGLMYAMALNNGTYGVNISLANPGREISKGTLVDHDRFDKEVGHNIALYRVINDVPLPKFIFSPRSKRTVEISRQFSNFCDRSASFFKDKSLRLFS